MFSCIARVSVMHNNSFKRLCKLLNTPVNNYDENIIHNRTQIINLHSIITKGKNVAYQWQ